MEPIVSRGEEVLIRVRVQPRASRERLQFGRDGRIRVAVTAPPADNAANEALRAYLARLLDAAKATVKLVQGRKSRDKVLAVSGVSPEQVREKLLQAAGGKE